MVYFPIPVFKHIISFLPRPCQVLARKIKHRLPRILEDRGKHYKGVWRWKDYTEYIIMVAHAHTNPLYYSVPGWKLGGDSDYICKLSLWHADPDEYGITTKSMKNYLKMNKIKGYSNKTKRELVTMCISF